MVLSPLEMNMMACLERMTLLQLGTAMVFSVLVILNVCHSLTELHNTYLLT